jgi:predicted P-loop ATPase
MDKPDSFDPKAAADACVTPPPWGKAPLHTNKTGGYRDVLANVVIVLRNTPAFADRVRFNEFTDTAEGQDLPWSPGGDWRGWTDADDLQLANWCQANELFVKPRTCADAVQVAARDKRVHPVRDRLDSLVWDGTERLSRWLFTYLGVKVEDEAKPTARDRYHKAVGRAWPISAVARIYKPGCKVDHALILESLVQGKKKSTTAATLAMEASWFADEIADLGSKDSAQDLLGKWIIELAELSALRKSEIERQKAFISRAVDHYRPSYARRAQDFPRQCVFIGSTNADDYLKDPTGNRRYWPVKTGKVDLDALRHDREQLWAEAVAAFKKGEEWWLDSEVEKAAREEQASRRATDAWEGPIAEHLVGRSETSVELILKTVIGLPLERHDQVAQNRVAAVLRAHKWERFRKRIGGTLSWFYRPMIEEADSEVGTLGTSGNGKAAETLSVPTVPTVPTVSDMRGSEATTPVSRKSCENGVGTGNSGNSPANAGVFRSQCDSQSGNRHHHRAVLGLPVTTRLTVQSIEEAFATRARALGFDPDTVEREQASKKAIESSDMHVRTLMIARRNLLAEVPS